MKHLSDIEAYRHMRLLVFNAEAADRAAEEWGMNCGPGAIAAICGLTLDELRPRLGDFEAKGYTNPTLMREILQNLGVQFRISTHQYNPFSRGIDWPVFGLARIQWCGPWTGPNVPARVAYRHTHWVAALRVEGEPEPAIFDINAINSGGWIRLAAWRDTLVPWLLECCEPKASGKWFLTHSIEIDRESLASIKRGPAA
jgi:hypothetical protein